ncbi:P-loop NTPase fold protein [Nostoc sp. DedSLP04]|uniref:P-loop NTPase fold protein n=1 Tax=Nostoc sp. DedSLP04 TaxID=3075401 RepID=UPI002AD1D33A|nr:P-loop NTPase fold protein [Nostoc sp. DedSLP04]MDZ8033422.1 P-loop NTPase fold protein [Nostoc sp. DedSLP04]
MINSFSSYSDINKAITSHNPFDRSLVVRNYDIWNKTFPDVPSINAHASDAVYQAIEQISTGKRSVIGITIKAEKGLGKSHLMSRIRRHIQYEGDSFFVYMSEVDYGDSNKIHSKFLNTLASSLKQTGNQNVMQWQEIATTLVNEVYKSSYTPQELMKRFPGVLAQHPKIVDALTAKVLKLKSNIENPYLIQAILWTLSLDKVSFAINWLAGRDLAQSQADSMGLPNTSQDDKEAEAFQTVCQILDLIGDYRTIVICFDELESVNCNEQGFTRAQVIALFAKDIYSKIKRGVLILAMFDETWTQQVKVVPQADSVIDRIGEKKFDLRHLNSDDVVTLVSHWLKDFYDTNNLTPPHPVYPFDENNLRELGKEKPIVRKVLQWCTNNCNLPGVPLVQVDPLHKIEKAFNKELTALDNTIDNYFEDSNTIADAIRFCLLTLKGETVERVTIDEVEEVIVKNVDKGYLNFRVIGKEDGRVIKIVVAVVQESSNKFVSAALRRLIDYKKFDMTRGCLVRAKDVKTNTKGKEHLDELLSKNLGGEFVKLSIEDIKPLLAILFVQQACKDYEVSEEEISKFVVKHKIAVDNYLIREILSDPSGQIPSGLINEECVPETQPIQNQNVTKELDAMLDNLMVKLGL